MNELTIFDRILSKEIPTAVVYEDDQVFAFNDVNPKAPVHVLVVPKQKVKRFSDLAQIDPSLTGILFERAAKIASELGLNQSGYRIVVNCGPDGQQTVEYLHVHILGGRQMEWPPG